MEGIIFKDRDGDEFEISESDDYLCYLSIDGRLWGCSPHHANKIIEKLQEVLDANKALHP